MIIDDQQKQNYNKVKFDLIKSFNKKWRFVLFSPLGAGFYQL